MVGLQEPRILEAKFFDSKGTCRRASSSLVEELMQWSSISAAGRLFDHGAKYKQLSTLAPLQEGCSAGLQELPILEAKLFDLQGYL